MNEHDALRDAHARTVRILEAFEDGDHGFVQVALEDLADDIRRTIEAEGVRRAA